MNSGSAEVAFPKRCDHGNVGTFSTAWIQCDNPQCVKWRRVSKEEAESIAEETKWYCYMNRDTYHNKCEDPEESYESSEEIGKKYGIKYITSPLAIGTLVWAKMHGYCRWPAIICKDPDLCESSIQSVDGDTLSYHVEFLGKKHCHSFVRAPLVTTYVKNAQLCELSPKLASDFKTKIRASKKSSKGFKRELKYEYQGGTVGAAIEEADKLFSLPVADRLKSVIFRPKVNVNEENVGANADKMEEHVGEVKEVPPGFRTPTMSPQMASLHLKSCFSSPAMSDRSDKRKRYTEGKGLSASLVHRSKEEKFALDLQAYQHNEKAFEHDLKRYWIRMGRPLKKLPNWEGEPVKLFSVFSAVNDRGGYSKVSDNKGGWQKIFQEATNTNAVKKGVKAKKFYLRYLLPFEMYLHGKDYSEYIRFLESTDDKVVRWLLHTAEKKCSLDSSKRRIPTESQHQGASLHEKLEIQSDPTEIMKKKRKGTPKHKPPVAGNDCDEDVGFPYQFSSTPIFKPKERTAKLPKDTYLDFSDNSDDDWKEMEQILKEIPTFFENEQALDLRSRNNQNQDIGYFSQAGSGSVADMNVKVEMPGTGSTQMEVVFYEDNTPEFHAEQEWENRFRPVNRNVVSEFDHSALCTKDAQRVATVIESEQMCDCPSEDEQNDQVLHEMEALQDEIGDIHNQLMTL